MPPVLEISTESGDEITGAKTQSRRLEVWKQLALVPWFVAGLLSLLVHFATPESSRTSAWMFALLSIGLSTWLFLRRGPSIDAVALLHFAFLVFVGIASVIALANPDEWRLAAYPIAISYFAHLLTSAFLPTSTPKILRLHLSVSVTNWLFFWGLGYLLLGVVLVSRNTPQLGPVPDSIAFSGVCLLGLAALGSVRSIGLLKWALVVVGFLTYSNLVFTGFGRLTLVALAVVMIAICAMRWNNKLVKWAMLAATWPSLLILSDYSGLGLASRGEGSAISPITTFNRLIDLHTAGHLALQHGHSFYATAVALVPKELWPGKPVGLALELAYIFNPEYARYGHTDVAMIYGEGLINFGFIGVPLICVGVAIWCRWLAKRQVNLLNLAPMSKARSLLLLVVLIASAGVVDLFWTGTFTYVARAGTRILVLTPLLLSVMAAQRRHGRMPGQTPALRS